MAKIALIGVVMALITLGLGIAFDRLPVIKRWIWPPEVRLGVAFYAYERGFTVDGKMKQTFSELRNLPTNCYFWQVPPRPLSKTTKVVDLHAQVLTKYRFENMSDERITNLRMSLASPLLSRATTVSATPLIEAKGEFRSTFNGTLSAYVLTVEAIPPRNVAIVSLETPLDDQLRNFLYVEHGKVSLPIVDLSADQFSKHNPTVDRINAKTMYKTEAEMRTGDKNISMAEKFEFKVLGPSDLESKDESYKLLPVASKCQEGTAGDW